INLDEWKDANGTAMRRELGLDSNSFVVLLPKKSIHKGCLDTLDALIRVASKIDSVAVLVLGGGKIRGYDGRVSRLRGQGVRVFELGYAPDRQKRSVFDACDVLVQPSRAEAFGLVYLETWAYSKPVIGSPFPAAALVIQA